VIVVVAARDSVPEPAKVQCGEDSANGKAPKVEMSAKYFAASQPRRSTFLMLFRSGDTPKFKFIYSCGVRNFLF
jgi:hypothetical protein